MTGLLPLLQQDALAQAHTTGLPPVDYLKTLHNPYSDVHLFHLDPAGLNRRVYVKVPHIGPQGPALPLQRLRAEFEMLQRLQRSPGPAAAAYGSVEPLNLYPGIPALATYEATPTTLREHYRQAARRRWPWRRGADPARHSLVDEVSHCGHWLRSFQETTAAGFGPFAVEPLLDYIDIRLQQLVALPGLGFTAELAQAIRQRVPTVARGLAPGEHRLCARHNDFSSHNILAHQGRIWVIDFSMVDTSSFAFDPATFWLELEMLKADPSHSAGFLSELQAHFLRAYGGITPEDPAFALVRCQYQLNRILTLHAPLRWPTPGALYRRTVVRRCLAGVQAFAAGTAF